MKLPAPYFITVHAHRRPLDMSSYPVQPRTFQPLTMHADRLPLDTSSCPVQRLAPPRCRPVLFSLACRASPGCALYASR
jgi:hypothetical protein